MNDLQRFLNEKSHAAVSWKPEIIDAASESGAARLRELLDSGSVVTVGDDYEEQLRELFAYLNPTAIFNPDFPALFEAYKQEQENVRPLWQHGRWVYYPWRGALVHALEDAEFQQLRTSRNRNLITASEQEKFANALVGIAGLSVGNSIALAIVLQGGANHVRLADFDQLALSNTNRVRGSITELGQNKAEMTARQIFEINPYATVEVFSDGLTEKNLEAFFVGAKKLDVMVDEIDNIAVKCLVRDHASKLRIPVLMATDNGDNGIVDVERYDLDPATKYFNGRMGEVSYESVKNLDKMGIGRLITKFVGARTVTPRMRGSLMEIGKTIVSWPQLGGAAVLNGPALAFVLRQMVCGLPVVNDRVLINLDEMFIPGYTALEERAKRDAEGDAFAKGFGL